METHLRIYRHWSSSLQFKLALALILLTTAILTGFGVSQYFVLKAEKTAYLTNSADGMIERLAQNLAEPLWNFAETQRDDVILLEMRERAVFAVVVKDARQQLVAAKIRNANGEIIATQEVIASRELLVRTRAIVKGKDALGTVELYLTQRFIQAELYRQIRNLAITILVLNSTLLIFFMLSLQRVLSRPIKRLLGVADAVAQGDFTQAITLRQHDEIGRLATAFQQMIVRLTDVVRKVKAAAEQIASGSQQLSISAAQLSLAVSKQAATAEEVSSTMEQIAANIRQNADNAGQTEKIAVVSAEDARKSGDAVRQTVQAMNSIAANIEVIEEIVGQTHMLSLNATIEASKAQEYGKGFGVVATEVRSLAERSGNAAKAIKTVVRDSLTIAETAGEMLTHLVPNIQKTAELVQEISAASHEQKSGAEQINLAVQQLDQGIQVNASVAEETAATAEALAQQAKQLQETIAFFRITEPLQETEADLTMLVDTLHTLDQETLAKIALVIETVGRKKDRRAKPAPFSAQNEPELPGEPRAPQANKSGSDSAPADELKSPKSSTDSLDQEFERY